MPRIIVIRPAVTDHGLRSAFLGRFDADLNEEGREQVGGLVAALASYPISFIAVSPLKRAIATAMPLSEYHGISLHPVAGFQGGDMGEWEMRTPEFIRVRDQSRFQAYLTDPDFPAPGGESSREIYARAYPDLVNIVNHARPDETMVLVLQEAVLRAVCCAALDLPLEASHRFTIDHASFGVFERIYPKGPYRMISWNIGQNKFQRDPQVELEEEFPGV